MGHQAISSWLVKSFSSCGFKDSAPCQLVCNMKRCPENIDIISKPWWNSYWNSCSPASTSFYLWWYPWYWRPHDCLPRASAWRTWPGGRWARRRRRRRSSAGWPPISQPRMGCKSPGTDFHRAGSSVIRTVYNVQYTLHSVHCTPYLDKCSLRKSTHFLREFCK